MGKYTHIYIYISNIQSVSEDKGYGLFTYRIYEEFPINLCECLMYDYCYIFPIQVYIIKLTYTAYHHHHQVALTAWSSLNLSCYPSLSSIVPSRSFRLHLVST